MFHNSNFKKITSTSLLAFMALGFGSTKTEQANATNLTDVSVELMLSIDVSGSVSTNEYNLQMDGYAAAFKDDEVISTIESLPKGLAVGVQFWSTLPAPAEPWVVLKTRQDSLDFADYLDTLARPSNETSSLYKWYDNEYYSKINWGTNVAGAISAAKDSIIGNEYDGDVLVIDISGDGKSNGYQFNANNSYDGYCDSSYTECLGVKNARDVAVGLGITINGLPIENPNTTGTPISDYYNSHVKGTGGFVETASSFTDFQRAATYKITTEIENAAGELGIPDANPDVIVTDEKTKVTYNLIDGDPDNNNAGKDTDPDGDNLSIKQLTVDGQVYELTQANNKVEITVFSGTKITVWQNGKLTYDPEDQFEAMNEGETKTKSFTYTVQDIDGNTNSAGVTLDLNGFADSPEAQDNIYATDEDTAKWMGVLENDTDLDTDKQDLTITKINGIDVTNVGDKITLSSQATVELRWIQADQQDIKGKHALVYDPTPSIMMQLLNEGESKEETITYTVEDDKGKTDVGTITITVTGIDDTFPD